jgi:pimeloyl-ACP methyl ester carboxylesterase
MVDTLAGRMVIGGPLDAPPRCSSGWNGNASHIGAEFPFALAGHRVYMPDIIGNSGKSAPSRPPTAGSNYADWARDLLDGLGLDQVISMGISGGGWMTLKLSAYAPERVLRGVAVSTDGLTSITWRKLILGITPATIRPNPTTVRWFVRTIKSPDAPMNQESEDFGRGIEIMLKYHRTQRNPGLLTDDELRRITSPLLVLIGEHECFFDPGKAVARARALIPGLVAAEIVPHAGHLMTADQPEFLEKRVNRFLRESS